MCTGDGVLSVTRKSRMISLTEILVDRGIILKAEEALPGAGKGRDQDEKEEREG